MLPSERLPSERLPSEQRLRHTSERRTREPYTLELAGRQRHGNAILHPQPWERPAK